MNIFVPIWTYLGLFAPIWTYLDLLGPIWTCMDLFGLICTYLDLFRPIWTLNLFGPGLIGPSWTWLDLYGPIWTYLGLFWTYWQLYEDFASYAGSCLFNKYSVFSSHLRSFHIIAPKSLACVTASRFSSFGCKIYCPNLTIMPILFCPTPEKTGGKKKLS